MSFLSWIHATLSQPDFWKFNAKDFVTGLIALAAFLTAATNVWVAYLRRHKLRCDLSDALRIGYGPRPDHFLMFKIDVFAMNDGARPGVITRMAIQLLGHHSDATLHWTEVTKTENIAGKGEARKVWTDFAGFASPILVPKYDARLIEAAFWADQKSDLAPGHTYRFSLFYWVAGSKKPHRGTERALKIDAVEHEFLETKATTNDKGLRARHLYLTSTDGRSFRAPQSTANLVQGWQRTTSGMPATEPVIAEEERTPENGV
jgi:hypothetical protein